MFDDRKYNFNTIDEFFSVTPPAQRVHFILGEDVGDDAHESHPLFSEMEELIKDGDEMEWKETARYLISHLISNVITKTICSENVKHIFIRF